MSFFLQLHTAKSKQIGEKVLFLKFLVACYATLQAAMSVCLSVGWLVAILFFIEFLIVFDRFFCEILFGQFFFWKIFFFFVIFVIFCHFYAFFYFLLPLPSNTRLGQPCIRPCFTISLWLFITGLCLQNPKARPLSFLSLIVIAILLS